MSIINIKNITISYNNHIAVSKANFKIEEGEYVCLVGENGSGKSTLMKAIAGLRKPDSGEIELNIEKEEVGYLAQFNSREDDFPATAREIILTGRQKHHKLAFYNKKDHEKFKEIIKLLKIEDIIDRRIGDLSGGQRQRILLARAICQEPEIIVLDEPTSFLDIRHKMEFLKILRKMAKDLNKTVIMSLHEIELAYKISDKILCVKGDTIEHFGKPEEIFTESLIKELFGLDEETFRFYFDSIKFQ